MPWKLLSRVQSNKNRSENSLCAVQWNSPFEALGNSVVSAACLTNCLFQFRSTRRDTTESNRVRDRWTFVVRKQAAPVDENENFPYKFFFFFFFFFSPLACRGNCQQQARQLLINCWIVASGRSCRYNPLIKTQSSPFATNFPAEFPSLAISAIMSSEFSTVCVSRSMWRKKS